MIKFYATLFKFLTSVSLFIIPIAAGYVGQASGVGFLPGLLGGLLIAIIIFGFAAVIIDMSNELIKIRCGIEALNVGKPVEQEEKLEEELSEYVEDYKGYQIFKVDGGYRISGNLSSGLYETIDKARTKISWNTR